MIKITIKKKTLQNIGLIFLGIFLGLLVLEIGLRIGGFILLTLQRNGNMITSSQAEIYRILALGESTTANLRNFQISWPEELEIILNNKSNKIKFKVFNEGIASTNTNVILSDLEANLDKYKPDIVITMMGINDVGMNSSYYKWENESAFSLTDFRVYKLTKRIIQGLEYNFQRKENVKEETDEEYKAKEKELIEAVEIDPMNPKAWANLEIFYDLHFEYGKTESVAEQHVLLEPNNWGALHNLGLSYKNTYKYKEAEYMFKKVIELNQSNRGTTNAYLQLGFIYSDLNKPEDAIKMLLKMVEIYGKFNKEVFIKLAELYREINKTNKTYIVLKKVVSADTDVKREILWLGEIYEELNKTEEALSLFNSVIERSPDNHAAYIELAWYYLNNNRTEEAEDIFNKLREMNLQYPLFTYEEIKNRYRKRGQFDKAEEMFNRGLEILTNDEKITQNNYVQLYNQLHKRGIKLIVMQYPTLNIDELKNMFKGDEDIVFVSNEYNFNKALENSPYYEYFIDSFKNKYAYGTKVRQPSATVFGHATIKGNKLIAENVANEVLKLV